MWRYAAFHGGTVLLFLGLVGFALWAVHHSLANQGIGFSFDYLWRSSGINISEGAVPSWQDGHLALETADSSSTNAVLLLAGVLNALKVAVLAIVLSTIIGVTFGVARLSTNWLVRKSAFALVEFIRNTPLLIQLVFWYFAVIMRLPPVTGAADALTWFVVGQSGIFVPLPVISDQTSLLSIGMLAGGLLCLVLAGLRQIPRSARLLAALFFVALLAGSWWVGFPLSLERPTIGRFGATGGMGLSPEFAAILLAITVNSSAYVAEIVRGAIEALPTGQWEAAASLGMSRTHTLRDVVLPQVFRIVLPSLGNRYISLAKDTSLGISIGFPDLFNVGGTVANQTGRNLETVLIVMTTYLLLSWLISLTMNAANNKLVRAGVER